nr:unnamed protein product [Callosobruchus chinensis]
MAGVEGTVCEPPGDVSEVCNVHTDSVASGKFGYTVELQLSELRLSESLSEKKLSKKSLSALLFFAPRSQCLRVRSLLSTLL